MWGKAVACTLLHKLRNQMLKNGRYAQFFWTGDGGCFPAWHPCSLAKRDCLHKVQRDRAESLSCPITALSSVGSYDCPRMKSVSWQRWAVLDLQRVLNAAEADAGSESSLCQLQAHLKLQLKHPLTLAGFLQPLELVGRSHHRSLEDACRHRDFVGLCYVTT